MQITFLRDWRQYKKGETHDVATPLARRAIGEGVADHTTKVKERIGRHPKEVDGLETATTSAPENAATRTKAPEPRGSYDVEHRGGPWYDVTGPDGEAVNDKALKSDEAEALKEEMEG